MSRDETYLRDVLNCGHNPVCQAMDEHIHKSKLPSASEFIEAVKKLADEYDVELVRCTATDKHGTSSFTRTGKGLNQTMPRRKVEA